MHDSERPLDPKDEKRLKTRGKGSGSEYEPFIKVHEISSRGESFRIFGRNSSRPHHLLSRLELSAFLVFDRYHLTIDIKEQYPVPIVDSLNICQRLGIKHPQIAGKLKVVTTDLVIEMKNKLGIAIAVKYANDLDEQRTVDKLQIEKCFWEQQGYEWKLFTEQEITPAIKENLEWLHAANQNSHDLYKDLLIPDIQQVFERLENSKKRLSVTCSLLDDSYSCDPGFHIGVIRQAIAANIIDVPLNKVFRQWTCVELSLVENLSLIKGGIEDAS
ncbi:TnsA endonuclease N-terminal domain-containing protein [Pseudoalteromonas sp. AOP31-A2-14]|uniref:TnsA endonuclease N-terminal domain-containing protein n=1 Tax=Pseudoalteromonas sp. AOP31-A2-14 TaxID=3457695 RepID=UPI00403707DB